MAERRLAFGFPAAWRVGAAIAAAVALAACNAPTVDRAAELDRFRADLDARTAGAAIKPGTVLTMKRAEEIALANSLTLAVRRRELGLEDLKVKLSLSGYFPSADLTYRNGMRSNANVVEQNGMSFPAENRHQQALNIAAIVPIFDFGVTYYAYKMAQDQRTQQHLLLKRTEQQLRRDVRIAYARYASELRQVVLTVQNVKAAEEVLRVAEAQQREGLSTGSETAVVRAALAQTRVAQSSAQQRVAETRLTLSQLLALPPTTDVVVDEALPALPPPPSLETITAYEDHALRVRPELHVQDLERHVSATRVRQQIAGFFPRLDGFASFNWSNNPFLGNPAFFTGGAQVAQSLLDFPTRLIRVQAAETQGDVEKERSLLLALGVLYDVDLRAIQLHRGRDTIAALEVQEQARKEAFDRVLSLYREGLENEAATARALVDLSLQTIDLDKARTDYQVWWYEFEAAALPGEPDPLAAPGLPSPAARAPTGPGVPAATQPTAQPATVAAQATTQATTGAATEPSTAPASSIPDASSTGRKVNQP